MSTTIKKSNHLFIKISVALICFLFSTVISLGVQAACNKPGAHASWLPQNTNVFSDGDRTWQSTRADSYQTYGLAIKNGSNTWKWGSTASATNRIFGVKMYYLGKQFGVLQTSTSVSASSNYATSDTLGATNVFGGNKITTSGPETNCATTGNFYYTQPSSTINALSFWQTPTFSWKPDSSHEGFHSQLYYTKYSDGSQSYEYPGQVDSFTAGTTNFVNSTVVVPALGLAKDIKKYYGYNLSGYATRTGEIKGLSLPGITVGCGSCSDTSMSSTSTSSHQSYTVTSTSTSIPLTISSSSLGTVGDTRYYFKYRQGTSGTDQENKYNRDLDSGQTLGHNWNGTWDLSVSRGNTYVFWNQVKDEPGNISNWQSITITFNAPTPPTTTPPTTTPGTTTPTTTPPTTTPGTTTPTTTPPTTTPPSGLSCNITASVNPISAGGSTTLTWTTTNATLMYPDQPYGNWTGAGSGWYTPVSGSLTVSPTSTTRYSIQVFDGIATITSCDVTVTVGASSNYTVNINKTEDGDDGSPHTYGFHIYSVSASGFYTFFDAANAITIPAAEKNDSTSWTTTTPGTYAVAEAGYGAGWTPSIGGKITSWSDPFTLNSTSPTVNLNFTNTYVAAETHWITVMSGTATSVLRGVNIAYEKYNDTGYGTFNPQNASTQYSLPSSGSSTTAFSQVFTADNNIAIGELNYKFKEWSVTNGDTLLSVENTAESTREITIKTKNNGTTLTAVYEPDFGTYTCIIGAPDKTTVSIGSDLTLPSAGYNSPPVGSGYDVKWRVNWGDGTSSDYQSSTLTTPPKHRYTTVGVKRITISLYASDNMPLKDIVGWMTELQALAKGYGINKMACDNGIEITVRQRTDDTGGEVAP